MVVVVNLIPWRPLNAKTFISPIPTNKIARFLQTVEFFRCDVNTLVS
jgi:hypothetical protein